MAGRWVVAQEEDEELRDGEDDASGAEPTYHQMQAKLKAEFLSASGGWPMVQASPAAYHEV